MSQKKQFRAQKAKATTKASKSARLPSTEKNAVFTLTGTFQKAKPDKAPGFHFFTEKLSAFRCRDLHEVKPDKAVKRQSGYYGCRRLHKRAEKLGVKSERLFIDFEYAHKCVGRYRYRTYLTHSFFAFLLFF